MRDLSKFSAGKIRISLKFRVIVWFTIRFFLESYFLIPSRMKISILRTAGANIGQGCVIRSLKVHFPWNLEIGNNSWIGEEVWIINHEKIKIGSDVCISQRSIICSGGHDYRSAALEYAHKPIEIKDGAWVCLDAKVLPGVTIGECSVVAAGEVVRKSIPNYSMLVDGKIRPIDLPK